MNSVDFQDSFYKIPASERVLQEQQQQPGVNQAINAQHDRQKADDRIDRPEQKEELENVLVERQKRDREFRDRKKKKQKQPQSQRPRRARPNDGHVLDVDA